MRPLLLALALGNVAVQNVAAAHSEDRRQAFSLGAHEVMPRLRRPVADRSERPVRELVRIAG